MTRWTSITIQIAGLVSQILLPQLGLEPDLTRALHALCAFIQAVSAVIAHHFNPDGTSARTPWR